MRVYRCYFLNDRDGIEGCVNCTPFRPDTGFSRRA